MVAISPSPQTQADSYSAGQMHTQRSAVSKTRGKNEIDTPYDLIIISLHQNPYKCNLWLQQF
ncbi:hypothetical protein BEN30_12120 [Magnetovibrio blakemorei]|uniref:Uncharacterized protein n=1 Tax=Magnetovibrio blakemorei TaxID=28181 RepID=A0A1E5Q6H9_9PROT|nr:hypothetical protein BEN30_12120 [Magnetovibrio blakemorei]